MAATRGRAMILPSNISISGLRTAARLSQLERILSLRADLSALFVFVYHEPVSVCISD
jgi:hypothetical protein